MAGTFAEIIALREFTKQMKIAFIIWFGFVMLSTLRDITTTPKTITKAT
jgi:hypothetical protein